MNGVVFHDSKKSKFSIGAIQPLKQFNFQFLSKSDSVREKIAFFKQAFQAMKY